LPNPVDVRAQIGALLHAHPELAEDSQLLADMLEGETDVMEAVRRLLTQYNEDRMLRAGIKTRRDELKDRDDGIELRMEQVKKTMRELLRLLPDGQRVLRLAEGTVSWRKPGKQTIIYNLDMLPQGFYRTKKEAQMTEITKALTAGEEVPGAQQIDGQDGVTIRNT
jgi:hypothetical protein